MKSFDIIIVGAGIIGLSLARELRKHGGRILVVERGQPGREASHAAGGMLVPSGEDIPASLLPLALASARAYPEFVGEIEDESGMRVDLRREGAIVFPAAEAHDFPANATPLSESELAKLEPHLSLRGDGYFVSEASVDPRALVAASLQAALHRGVEVVSGSPVKEVACDPQRNLLVRTAHAEYAAQVVVNCCGAWSGQFPPFDVPARPAKGQMLSVAAPRHNFLCHVVRAPEVYLIPRSDGRILIGATVEDAGFDKRVDPDTIQKLHQAAANLLPELGEVRMLEAWAGLRPGSPDHLPIMGRAGPPGCFVSTGHYRNGILLAPVSACVMAQLIGGLKPDFDLSAFSPARFSS